MGLFKNFGNTFSNIVSTVTNGASSLVSGVASGLITPISNTAGTVISNITPLVKETLNSSAVSIAAAGASSVFGGKNTDSSSVASIMGNGGSNAAVRPSAMSDSNSGMSFFSKLFNFYQLDESGNPIVVGGKKQLNFVKITIFSVVTIGLGYLVGKKMRWFR